MYGIDNIYYTQEQWTGSDIEYLNSIGSSLDDAFHHNKHTNDGT